MKQAIIDVERCYLCPYLETPQLKVKGDKKLKQKLPDFYCGHPAMEEARGVCLVGIPGWCPLPDRKD